MCSCTDWRDAHCFLQHLISYHGKGAGFKQKPVNKEPFDVLRTRLRHVRGMLYHWRLVVPLCCRCNGIGPDTCL